MKITMSSHFKIILLWKLGSPPSDLIAPWKGGECIKTDCVEQLSLILRKQK